MAGHHTRAFKPPRDRRGLSLICATVVAMAAVVAGRALLVSAAPAPPKVVTVNDDMTAALGKALFKRVWVPAPSSTRANDGLGPLFNGRSCAQCHSAAGAGKLITDAAGRLTERGAVVRLSNADGLGDPIYGTQIQTRAVPRIAAEATVRISFQTHAETFDDGTPIVLRRPVVALDHFAYGMLANRTEPTLIVAPSLRTAARIAKVDTTTAAFGLKGTTASLEDMTSLAFLRDLGLSTPLHAHISGDCTAEQSACLSAPHGADFGGAEISADIVAMIAHYLTTLAAPTSPKPTQPHGAALFSTLGCATCHRREMPGRDGKAVTLYSDLARHPMGSALAGLTEANGQSRDVWRTAPLIDMQSRLAAGASLLHDGRAQTVAEAILWHGGAADEARKQYKALSKDDRLALEQYVLSR